MGLFKKGNPAPKEETLKEKIERVGRDVDAATAKALQELKERQRLNREILDGMNAPKPPPLGKPE